MEAPGRVFRLQQEEGTRSPVMGSFDHSTNASGANEGRQPLKSLQTPATMSSSITGPLGSMEGGRMKQSPATHWYHHWPASLQQKEDHKESQMDVNPGGTVASFELEDTTTGSGGTSWTLRVPWLRNKRRKSKLRLDDENSSIQTIPSRSLHNNLKPGVYTEETPYYGGLMKAASPTFVSVDSGNIEALQQTAEGDGLYRTTPVPQPSPRVLHEQRQPQRQQPKQPYKQKRKSSSSSSSKRTPPQPKPQRKSFANVDQNLLIPQPQKTPPPPTSVPIATVPAAANTPPAPSSDNRQYVMLQPRLEPKNHNKVFRNRSWISTSSRSTNRLDDDSLADFDEAEWTPQDSSYGAAIPVCGWVPKRLRQGIEATLISLAVFVLVYLVVTTSISISEAKDAEGKVYNESSSGVKAYDNALDIDDDWYVDYSQYPNDAYEDDYYDYNNGGNGNGRDNNGNRGG